MWVKLHLRHYSKRVFRCIDIYGTHDCRTPLRGDDLLHRFRHKSLNKYENVNRNSLTPLRRVRYERLLQLLKKTNASRKQQRENRGETGETREGERGETVETKEVQKEEEIICTPSIKHVDANQCSAWCTVVCQN